MSITWLAKFEAWYIMQKKHNILEIDYSSHLPYIRVRYYVPMSSTPRIIEQDFQLKDFINQILLN